jgi:hypothetical protein
VIARTGGAPIEHNLGVMGVSRSYTALIDRLVAPSANYGV